MKKIEFYFDFLSPFSYLAWTRIRDLNLNLEFYPVSLPNIISSYETKGPGQIKPKRDYLSRQILRYKTKHNIPFKYPPALPFNSLYALRLSLKGVADSNQKDFVDLFYRMAYEYGTDLGDSDLIQKNLSEKGFNAEVLMDKISTKEVKLELRSNIEKALSRGVFGVPTFVVIEDDHQELFWGNDSIEDLLDYLNGKDVLPKNEYQQFITNFPMWGITWKKWFY